MTATMRPELPSLPYQMCGLPLSPRGYPVPWFVVWQAEDGTVLPRGEGTPDFRVLYPDAVRDAVMGQRCWICGKPNYSVYKSFVAGPMCGINRVSAEPPSHHDCAVYAATACPFLVRPHARRREDNLPTGHALPPGVMIKHNPGVAMVWTTRDFALLGVLFRMGDAEQVEWFAQGGEATRAQVDEAIERGLPLLVEAAEQDGPAGVEAVEAARELLVPLLPAG